MFYERTLKMSPMGTRFGAALLGLAIVSSTAYAQTPAKPATSTSEKDTRSAKTTASGDTGLFFVPTAEVLPAKRFSFSLYRTNIDDGQGFTDISNFPVTVGVGVGGRMEIFGAFNALTRLDRDTRPLFFSASDPDGTGGGILPAYPLARNTWVSTVGDLWLGAKINLASEADQKLSAFAIRGQVKIPTGSKDDGTTSGKPDFGFDAILSKEAGKVVEISGYAGYLVRGNPANYKLTNSFRYGAGHGFPTRKNFGFSATAEVFGEFYQNKTITAPSGQLGTDGSPVPTSTILNSPVVVALGLTWQAPNGFFVGGAASWNMHMAGRDEVPGFNDEPKDDKGLQIRIGFHPGARRYVPPPPPPPPPPPVATPTPTPAPANRPPTVRAMCDPCTVEVGKTATVSADAQDPDGDALTYRWTAPAGTLSSPTTRQSPWTAPMVEGPVRITVAVDDGKGGTATDTVTINVTKPVVREYNFEDVHFDFDRSALRPEALRVLDEAVAAMQANSTLRLEIEGHTCNIGTNEYNLALGDRRAQSVRDYLVSRGISADRLRTRSLGEEQPKYDNSREETRRLNRRAALVVRLTGS
jgi:outer membrane protein OmpA-like peptidoglycan-associated protein